MAMRRKTLDALLTTAGLAIAAVLIVAGALLTWANSFIGDQVHNQLAQQQIFFPSKGSPALASPDVSTHLNRYAGKQLLTGPEARAYADHYIAVHLEKMTGGKTYAQLSSAAQANPADTKLASQVETVFRGETLRGLLLNAYAFATMGSIAGIAAVVSFVGAGVLLVLAALGLWHLRRTDATSGRAAQAVPTGRSSAG